MPELEYATAHGDADLRQILALQRVNLEAALSPEAVAADGFVTVEHDLDLLREMNAAEGHVVARHGEAVVAYALVMVREFADRLPVLAPMFAELSQLDYGGRAIDAYRHFVMGQVCVAREWRGSGVFAGMFARMRELYSARYDLVITEVARRNTRSVRAHAMVGFELLHRYTDDTGEDWDLIVWDWTDRASTGGEGT